MDNFAPNALFAYGTLALPDVVDALTGRVPEARPARLAGYRCRLLLGEAFPGVERYPGSATDGVLYSGLSPADLSILDSFLTAAGELQGRENHHGGDAVPAFQMPGLCPVAPCHPPTPGFRVT